MSGSGEDGDEDNDMVCYKGGLAIEQNFQMCDVTSMCFLPAFLAIISPWVVLIYTRRP